MAVTGRKNRRKGVGFGRAATKNPGEGNVKTHVGYYLLDDGWKELAQTLNCKGGRPPSFPADRARKSRIWSYFPSLVLCFLLIYTGLLWSLSALQAFTPLQLVFAGLLLLAPVAGSAVRLVHAVLNWVFPPQILPKIEFRNGIPLEAATMVVIPTILGSMEDVESLLRKLEVYHLANTDPHIYFALLTDFPMPRKRSVQKAFALEAAPAGIAALNERYPHPRAKAFSIYYTASGGTIPGKGSGWGWGTEARETYRVQRATRRGRRDPFLRRSPATASFINRRSAMYHL